MFDLPDTIPVGPTLVAVAILVVATVFSGASQATPVPLSELELSQVRGADGSINAVAAKPAGNGGNRLDNGLAEAFSSSTGPVMLDAAQFAAALPPGVHFADYHGQPVGEVKVDAPPTTFSFDMGELLQSATGSGNGQLKGPSMGTFTMNAFDARGTTLFVWHH